MNEKAAKSGANASDLPFLLVPLFPKARGTKSPRPGCGVPSPSGAVFRRSLP